MIILLSVKAQEAEKLKSSESAAFLAIASPAGDLKEEEQTVRKPQDLKNRLNIQDGGGKTLMVDRMVNVAGPGRWGSSLNEVPERVNLHIDTGL